MELLNSPLKKSDFDQIDGYFNIHKSNFLKLDVKQLSIDKFKNDFGSFNKCLINLSDVEKTRAWLYLYSKVTKHLKDHAPIIQISNKDQVEYSTKIISSIIVVFILAIGGWGIYTLFNREESPENKLRRIQLEMIASAQVAVSGVLKDPDSARFRNQIGYCGEVNSKNSFGGYTGYTRYFAPSSKAIALESGMDQIEFEEIWGKFCK